MASLAAARQPTREGTLNIRAKRQDIDLIDYAAQAVGKTRSGFIMENAIKAAESVLLDKRIFLLEDVAYDRFLTLLDESPTDNPRLRALLRTKAPWEK